MINSIDKKELPISLARSIFSAVPFVGQLLNEVVFEYRGRIKQERLNSFTQLLSDYFTNNLEIDLKNLETEDFSDLLESVLKRVVQTKSIEKQKRLRDILVNKIQNPFTEIDNSEIYLDLITNLSEVEINILHFHLVLVQNFDNVRNNISRLQNDLNINNNNLKEQGLLTNSELENSHIEISDKIKEIEGKIQVEETTMESLQKCRESSFYGISEDKFLYYKQSLYSKGLMIDSGVGFIAHRQFKYMSITEFGKGFIQFIAHT